MYPCTFFGRMRGRRKVLALICGQLVLRIFIVEDLKKLHEKFTKKELTEKIHKKSVEISVNECRNASRLFLKNCKLFVNWVGGHNKHLYKKILVSKYSGIVFSHRLFLHCGMPDC